MNRIAGAAVLVAAVFAVATAPAQQQVAPTDQPTVLPGFAERVEVAVGNVDVTVLDSDGNLVTGLGKDDFVLTVDGQPRAIDYFGAYTRSSQVVVGGSPEAAPAAAGVIPPPAPPRPRVQVILIDNSNTAVFNRNHILGRVAEYVKRTLRPPDAAIVAVYENYLRFATPLTSDPDEIVYAIEEMRESSANVGQNTAFRLIAERQIRDYAERANPNVLQSPELDQALVSARVNAQQMRDHTERTVDAFKVLLRTMSGVPGRKSVLYVSDGLPRSPGIETFQLVTELFPMARMSQTEFQTYETTPLWNELGRWAAAADVTFYTLDARGLQAGAEKAAEFGRTMSGGRGADQRKSTDIEVLHLQNYQDPMIAMANLTGGMAIVNTNKFDEGLDQINESMETYYSLGFTLGEEEADQLHSIRVAVKDRDGLRLRYRTALVERSTESRMADRTYAGLGFGILENPLAIRAEIGEPTPAGRKTYNVPIKVLVPVDKLTLLPQGSDMAGKITVWTIAAGEKGKLSPLNRQEHVIVVPAAKLGKVGTLAITTTAEVGEGTCRVSVGVLDEATGESGFAAAEKQVGKS